jgi:hypothetical protein
MTTLHAGAAKVDITPADLTALNPMGGGNFAGVHDPLFLRALVLRDGTEEAALVSCDLIEAGDMTDVRKRIESELGIPRDHVFITATHTHNAPRIGLVSPGSLAHGGGPEVAAYTEYVYDQMLAALRQARAAARPARAGFGTGSADVNVNRDEYAGGRWRIGYNPEGPSDKTVWVVRFESLDGTPIAVLVNYGVHSTVTLGTREISGDLAGATSRYVEQQLGGNVVALFTPGPLGDQAPRVCLEREPGAESPFAYQAMEAQGVIVGAEAVRVARAVAPADSAAPVRAAERVIPCPVKRGVDVMDDMKQEDVPFVDLRLGLLMVGRIALVGVSGEVVTRICQRLRRESPLAATILISIVNDRIGYIADDQAYDRPTHEVNGSPIQRGYAEDAIVTGAVDMITSAL